MNSHSDGRRGAAGVATLRVVCRLLRLVAAASAGTAVTITVLKAMASDPADLPGQSMLITLLVVAVVTFLAATLLMVLADRFTERSEREAVQGHTLTAEEREAERLRETPLLARESSRQQRPPLEF